MKQPSQWRSHREYTTRNLNPMEEARALKRLQSEFDLSQQEVANAVGKSRPLLLTFFVFCRWSRVPQSY